MKICENCDGKIPATIVVEGKRRNLQRRKYCLVCSPFGKHNTINFQKPKTGVVKCVQFECELCGKPCTYKLNSYKGKRVCFSCKSNHRRKEVKEKSIAYLGGECQRCGYSKSSSALQFHHRDPDEKDFQIAGNHCRSWETIQRELDKCDLLCSNCHCEVHEEIFRARSSVGRASRS